MVTLDPTTLIGTWEFARSIEDRLSGEATSVEGVATFVPEDRWIRWHEDGTWFRAAEPVAVRRTLRIEERDGDWFVTFEDGRDFHPWLLRSGFIHPCGHDTYAGLLAPGTDAAQWRLTWSVSGPAKDYTMRTTYTRA